MEIGENENEKTETRKSNLLWLL